jgi:hypothetical protein
MPDHSNERLTVRVRLLDDPCLWAWEIWDEARGRVIEDGWRTQWAAYASREEAENAGWRRMPRQPGDEETSGWTSVHSLSA